MTTKIIRFVVKAIGAFAMFVFFSLPEADFLEGRNFFEAMFILLLCMIACAIPMALAVMVCVTEDKAKAKQTHTKKGN
jgi:ABC-type Fe3+ transport system permease subunit